MRWSKGSGSFVAASTVLAPIAWGTTYVTITETLPAGRPLLVAALRVLPAGIVLVLIGTAVSRWRPRGVEWGHTALVALFNFALFFPLLFVAVYRLPGGVAAAGGGLQPLFVLVITAGSTSVRPTPAELAAAGAAALGVALVVVRPGAASTPSECWRRSARTCPSRSVSSSPSGCPPP